MKVTAQDLLSLGVIERVVAEPTGGAHRDAGKTAQALLGAIEQELDVLSALPTGDLLARREERFLKIGRA